MSNNQEDTPECLLCMEVLEADDLSFFPCSCGYQICRFCWHRIRTNESGLCPACRKPYSENPAHFKPLTEEEILTIKKNRRQKESQKKQKPSENRKNLTNVRIVQKNLVFVVGLSQRLADSEVLRRHEYFGKFGKISKIIINHTTSYIGSQGPSPSAYVTYVKTEDALHAIGVVNNLTVDNRILKVSLGTTKYCSSFIKGIACTKSECMYLHELAEEAASFTKEDIQLSKHLQYEQKLAEQYLSTSGGDSTKLLSGKTKPNLLNISIPSLMTTTTISKHKQTQGQSKSTSTFLNPAIAKITNKKPWGDINIGDILKERDSKTNSSLENIQNNCSKGTNNHTFDSTHSAKHLNKPLEKIKRSCSGLLDLINNVDSSVNNKTNTSLFGFNKIVSENTIRQENKQESNELENFDSDTADDYLGFDPWDICSKGLADMMEKEKILLQKSLSQSSHSLNQPVFSILLENKSNNQENVTNINQNLYQNNNYFTRSNSLLDDIYMSQLPSQSIRSYNLKHSEQQNLCYIQKSTYVNHKINDNQTDFQQPLQNKLLTSMSPSLLNRYSENQKNGSSHVEGFNTQGWQDSLKALLPNINISFDHTSSNSVKSNSLKFQEKSNLPHQSNQLRHMVDPSSLKCFKNSSNSKSIQSINSDPAIISTGLIRNGASLGCWQHPFTDFSLNNQTSHYVASNKNISSPKSHTITNNTLMNGLGQLWMQKHLSSRYSPPGFSRHPNSEVTPFTEHQPTI